MGNTYDDDVSAMLRYGVSEELIGLFDALATATVGGDGKYPGPSIAALRKALLCRTYGKALWELAHLLAAVAACDVDGRRATTAVANFFWQDRQASAANFRQAFREPFEGRNMSVELKDALHIAMPDRAFQISPSRYGFLSALLQFVTFVDPSVIVGLSDTLATINAKTVDALAKDMQSRVAKYLSEHMQPEHQQRKSRAMLIWLAEQKCTGADINDQTVLDFWLYAMETELKDFKRFNIVAEDFFRLLALLSEGRSARYGDFASSLGHDRDAGEIDPERLEDLIDDLEAESSVFSELALPPLNHIKFLMDSDRQILEPVDAAGPGRSILPLTLARLETLGAVQNRISQHLRTRTDQSLSTLLSCHDAKTYDDYRQDLKKRREKMIGARDATLHILRHFRHPEAAACAVGGLSDDARRAVLARLGVAEGDETLDAALLANLSRLALQHPELNSLVSGWASAFKRVNRAGFVELPDESQSDDYAAGLRLIEILIRRLDSFTAALNDALTSSASDEPRFDVDRDVFATAYTNLYGVNHD